MMNDQSTLSPTNWFWVAGALGLVWNLMGVANYISQVTRSPEALAAFPAEQQELLQNVPAWATGAFAIAVFAGALGCFLLILRKKLAVPVLGISLLAILIQMAHSVFMTNAIEVSGAGFAIGLPVLVIVVAAALLWIGRMATAKGWMS